MGISPDARGKTKPLKRQRKRKRKKEQSATEKVERTQADVTSAHVGVQGDARDWCQPGSCPAVFA